MRPRVNILYVPGTNCHRETAEAFRRVGGEPAIVLLADLLSGAERLSDADVVCLPGGFAFGDHIGAGNVAAAFLTRRLRDQLVEARARPMICICNGFQVAVRTGIFGAVSLVVNEGGTFRDEPRQRHVVADDNDSFWLDGLRGATMEFPCAHGEGRFIYEQRDGWRTALRYPPDANPDGSSDDIAGITTRDGIVLGLMDHPERAPEQPLVHELFANAIRVARG
jgi:phosphoribosylformylglycinamidine synthase subunit PurQ / glutaminase